MRVKQEHPPEQGVREAGSGNCTVPADIGIIAFARKLVSLLEEVVLLLPL